MAGKDAVLDRAVDLAREAAVEVAENPGDVGEHLGAMSEADRLVTHTFACLAAGYRGWVWSVTVARVPRGRVATVCEAVLLPGDDALVARPWLPWAQRLQPGDIGPGDVLPFAADDPRLEPGWRPSGDPELDTVAIDELALARERVLSPVGRDEAAQRWYRGPQGPTSSGAVASAAACLTCGFMVPVQGALGQVFALCANEWSPEDGRVVSLDHGCGAHSQTDVPAEASVWPLPDPLIDDERIDALTLDRVEPPAVEVTAPVAARDEPAAAVPDASADESAGTAQDAEDGTPEDLTATSEPAARPGDVPADPVAADAQPVSPDRPEAGPEPIEQPSAPATDEQSPTDEHPTDEYPTDDDRRSGEDQPGTAEAPTAPAHGVFEPNAPATGTGTVEPG